MPKNLIKNKFILRLYLNYSKIILTNIFSTVLVIAILIIQRFKRKVFRNLFF